MGAFRFIVKFLNDPKKFSFSYIIQKFTSFSLISFYSFLVEHLHLYHLIENSAFWEVIELPQFYANLNAFFSATLMNLCLESRILRKMACVMLMEENDAKNGNFVMIVHLVMLLGSH